MKTKRNILPLAAAIAVSTSFAAVPLHADTHYAASDNTIKNIEICPDDPFLQEMLNSFPSDTGSVSYIIDFFDHDGSLLDSKLCQYGEKLENIITPNPREDAQYSYQFLGWDPQLPETVTESMAFIAVYRQTTKDTVSGSEIPQDMEDPITKASSTGSDRLPPGEITQVSSTSYDVTSFHVETPAAGTTDIPGMTNIPGTTDIPEVTGIPGAADIPGVTGIPGAADIPEMTGMPESTGIPQTTDIPGTLSFFGDTLSENHTVSAVSAVPSDTYHVNVTEIPAPAAVIDIPTTVPLQTGIHTHDAYTEKTNYPAVAKTMEKTAKTAAPAPTAAAGPNIQAPQKIPSATEPGQTSESRSPLLVFLACIVACGAAVWSKNR